MEIKKSDIILKKEWYEHYVECYYSLKEIKKVMLSDTIKTKLYDLVGESKIWDKMIDIFDNANIRNPKEQEEWECSLRKVYKQIKRREGDNHGTSKQTKRKYI